MIYGSINSEFFEQQAAVLPKVLCEALHYLKDGIIYCLGVQDCYSIGFDTLQVAVKIADGNLPGDLFPDKTDESTTIIYQEDAEAMLEVLYGDVSQ